VFIPVDVLLISSVLEFSLDVVALSVDSSLSLGAVVRVFLLVDVLFTKLIVVVYTGLMLLVALSVDSPLSMGNVVSICLVVDVPLLTPVVVSIGLVLLVPLSVDSTLLLYVVVFVFIANNVLLLLTVVVVDLVIVLLVPVYVDSLLSWIVDVPVCLSVDVPREVLVEDARVWLEGIPAVESVLYCWLHAFCFCSEKVRGQSQYPFV